LLIQYDAAEPLPPILFWPSESWLTVPEAPPEAVREKQH